MIDFTLRQNYYFRSSLFRKQLNYHLYKSPHSIVFHFEDYYDLSVRHELERNQRVISFCMEDFFRFRFSKKPLLQIVSEDILLSTRNEQTTLCTLQDYVILSLEYLKVQPYEQIKETPKFPEFKI